MAYDRYDTRRGQNPDQRERGGREDRGFFERAGDEIASWFGDDEAERRRREDERMNHGRDLNRDRNSDRERPRGSSRDYDRGYGRDYERDRNRSQDYNRGFFPEHGYLRSEYDAGYEDRSSDRPMKWTSSDRSYRQGARRGSGYGSYGSDNWGTGWNYAANGGPTYRFADRDRSQRNQRDFDSGSDRSDDFRQTSYAGSGRDYDRHYQAWRQRHLDELDRDYDDYHRENQERFENDFGSWRERRMQKRGLLSQVREHSEVVGSDGEKLGTVDRVSGDRIILTKSDSPDNRHHSIPCTMVERIEGDKVILDTKAEDAKSRWRGESSDRALFEREDQGEAGPRNLDRSFAGTYDKD
jgi:hypothetical protein